MLISGCNVISPRTSSEVVKGLSDGNRDFFHVGVGIMGLTLRSRFSLLRVFA